MRILRLLLGLKGIMRMARLLLQQVETRRYEDSEIAPRAG